MREWSKLYVESAISQDSKEEKTHFSHFNADDIETVEKREFINFFKAQISGQKLLFQDVVIKTFVFLLGTRSRITNPTTLTMNDIRLVGPSPYLYLGE